MFWRRESAVQSTAIRDKEMSKGQNKNSTEESLPPIMAAYAEGANERNSTIRPAVSSIHHKTPDQRFVLTNAPHFVLYGTPIESPATTLY